MQYSLCYADECSKLAEPVSVSLRRGSTALCEEMPLRWQAVGNNETDLDGPRFEPQASAQRQTHYLLAIWPVFLYLGKFNHHEI